jgi:hypothetical protein
VFGPSPCSRFHTSFSPPHGSQGAAPAFRYQLNAPPRRSPPSTEYSEHTDHAGMADPKIRDGRQVLRLFKYRCGFLNVVALIRAIPLT